MGERLWGFSGKDLVKRLTELKGALLFTWDPMANSFRLVMRSLVSDPKHEYILALEQLRQAVYREDPCSKPLTARQRKKLSHKQSTGF